MSSELGTFMLDTQDPGHMKLIFTLGNFSLRITANQKAFRKLRISEIKIYLGSFLFFKIDTGIEVRSSFLSEIKILDFKYKACHINTF